MYLDNTSLIYFFLTCSIFIAFLGFQIGYRRLPKAVLPIQLTISLSFLMHPMSIFFVGMQDLRIMENTPLQKLEDSLIFFDLFALMLFCIMLSRPSKKNLWKNVLVALLPTVLFFILAYASLVKYRTIGEMSILLSFSFILIFGCIFFQCIKVPTSGPNSKVFFKNLKVIAAVSVILWGLWITLQIQNDSDYLSHRGLYTTWLLLKIILLIIMIQFINVIDESTRETAIGKFLKDLKSTLSESSTMTSVLYNFPVFILLTNKDGRVVFANKTALSRLGISNVVGRDFDSIFMDSIEEAVTFARITFKDQNNALHMFAVRTEKMTDDEKHNGYLIWILKAVDFDFDLFCKSIINNRESFKVTGLLDHNFAIYRMSNTWKKLIGPLDKFFHSGVIWDKLKLVSESSSEIAHIENKITTDKHATGWLRIQSGNALVVTLEKIYAPDKRLFYHFNARYVVQ